MKLNSTEQLREWAAYVLGHHPHLLHLAQRELWSDLLFGISAAEETQEEQEADEGEGNDEGETEEQEDEADLQAAKTHEQLTQETQEYKDRLMASWPRPRDEAEELAQASRILALSGDLHAAILVEFHRILDEVRYLTAELRHPVKGVDVVTQQRWPFPPKEHLWMELRLLSKRLMSRDSPALSWYNFGTSTGCTQYVLGTLFNLHPDWFPEEIAEFGNAFEELAAHNTHQILGTMRDFVKAVCEPMPQYCTIRDTFTSMRDRKMNLARLDSEVKAKLRHMPPPRIVLVLNKDQIDLFGESMSLAGHSQDQIACLWVLAENAGRFVKNEQLRKEAKLGDINDDYFKVIVSRLRSTILRPLLARYREHNPGRQTTSEKNAFIIGRKRTARRPEDRHGYFLDLEPAQVRITSSRPEWME